MNEYERTGIASLLPGMSHILTCISAEVDRMLALANGKEPNYVLRARKLVPSVRSLVGPGSEIEPEFINQEAIARKSAEVTRTRLSAAAKRYWDNMTPRQKRARLDAMFRGRKIKKKGRM